MTSKDSGIIERCDGKKLWHWSWPFRGVLSELECHQGCLAPLLEREDLLDLERLDVVRKDPMTPAPAERALSLRPGVEELIGVPTLMSHLLWSQRRLLNLKDWSLHKGEDHKHPLGLPFPWQMTLTHPPRGHSLSSQYTPRGPVGPEFFGDPEGNSVS